MQPNAQLIERFYSAFARRDAESMAACYRRDVEFCDPVFPDLRGDAVSDMWRWSRMALGAPGWLLGWSPMLVNRVRGQAARGLQSFRTSRAAETGRE